MTLQTEWQSRPWQPNGGVRELCLKLPVGSREAQSQGQNHPPTARNGGEEGVELRGWLASRSGGLSSKYPRNQVMIFSSLPKDNSLKRQTQGMCLDSNQGKDNNDKWDK